MLHDKLLQDPAHLQELMHLLTQSITADVQGKSEEAMASLELAIKLDPGFVPALMRRADLLLAAERYHEAITAYDDCLHVSPLCWKRVNRDSARCFLRWSSPR